MNKYQEALDEIKSTEKYDLFDEYRDDIFEKVKVFADDDENIKTLQELIDKHNDLKHWKDFVTVKKGKVLFLTESEYNNLVSNRLTIDDIYYVVSNDEKENEILNEMRIYE